MDSGVEIRAAGRVIGDALAAFPAAGPRIALFVHGLCETEEYWSLAARRHQAAEHPTLGSRLRHDLGYTPVYLRYNTGLHVSDNGLRLSVLLDELVAHWPVEVQRIALIGHSMGGLVIRSAGVHDLDYGALVEEDWRDVDPDELPRDYCTDVPFLAHADHYFIGATLTRRHDGPLATVLGDLVVPYRSAAGAGDRRRLPFDSGNGRHLGGLHHFDLLNHPAVHDQVCAWLAEPPVPGDRP